MQKHLIPILKRLKELDIQLPNMVADIGYINSQDRLQHLVKTFNNLLIDS